MTNLGMENSPMAPYDDDIKKASFYVWFLGHRECGGIRGDDVVIPALRTLIEKEKQDEPPKITLQISSRGLKVVQTVQKISGQKTVYEVVKQAIPQTSLTYVCQGDGDNSDVVSCIILSINTSTKSPVNVHVFRCDSEETATYLYSRLVSITQKPENKRKIDELEQKLKSQGLVNDKFGSRVSLCEKKIGTISKFPERERVALLHDSLAAELRDKLRSAQRTPQIITTNKDYIEKKKAKRLSVTEARVIKSIETRDVSSGNSSGIGSDDAASPVLELKSPRSLSADSVPSDDEDWHERQTARQTQFRPYSKTHFDPVNEVSAKRDQRSISPTAAHERFQDAKNKFLMLEKQQNPTSGQRTPSKSRQEECAKEQKVQRRKSFYDSPTKTDENRNPTLKRATSKLTDNERVASHLPRSSSYQETKGPLRRPRFNEDSDPWNSPNSIKIEMVERKGKYSPQFLFPDKSNENLALQTRNYGRSFNDLRSPIDRENQNYKSCLDLRQLPKDRRSLAAPEYKKSDKSKRMSLAEKIEKDTIDRKNTHKYELSNDKRLPGLDRETARAFDYDFRDDVRPIEGRFKPTDQKGSPFHDHRRDMNQNRFERHRPVNPRF